MVAVQFACPQCTEPFTVEDPASGDTVPCPHCGQKIKIPDLGLPDEATAAAALDFLHEEVSAGRTQTQPGPRRVRPGTQPFDRVPRRRRQQSRSLVVMILCLAVLAIAVVFISRL